MFKAIRAVWLTAEKTMERDQQRQSGLWKLFLMLCLGQDGEDQRWTVL